MFFQGITSQRGDGWTVSRVHTSFTATAVNGPSRASFSPRFILRFTNPTPGVATTSTPCQESGFAWCSPTSSYTTTTPGNSCRNSCRKSLLWLFSFSVFLCWCRSCLVRCHWSPLDSRDAGPPPSCRSHFCVFPLGSLSLGDLIRFTFC